MDRAKMDRRNAHRLLLLNYGTWKVTLLESVPLGVTTRTTPDVAPSGTLVVLSELDTTLNVAAVPLNVTLVAPFRSVPRILTAAFTSPDVGSVFTNGPRPMSRLKVVPPQVMVQLGHSVPPACIVPWRVPLVSCISVPPPFGPDPSVPSKLCSV